MVSVGRPSQRSSVLPRARPAQQPPEHFATRQCRAYNPSVDCSKRFFLRENTHNADCSATSSSSSRPNPTGFGSTLGASSSSFRACCWLAARLIAKAPVVVDRATRSISALTFQVGVVVVLSVGLAALSRHEEGSLELHVFTCKNVSRRSIVVLTSSATSSFVCHRGHLKRK